MAAQPPRNVFENRWETIRRNARPAPPIQIKKHDLEELKKKYEERKKYYEKFPNYYVKVNDRYYQPNQAMALAEITSGEKPSAIKFMPDFTSAPSAEEWLRRHKKLGLFNVSEEDINQDGFKDIVVLDKFGRPFAVNGYVLNQSNFPAIRKYYSEHATPEDRKKEKIGSYYNRLWGVDSDYNKGVKALEKNIKDFPEYMLWEKSGYKIPKRPKSLKSISSIICNKYIIPVFELFISQNYELNKKYYKIFANQHIAMKFYSVILKPILMNYIPEFVLNNDQKRRRNLIREIESIFYSQNMEVVFKQFASDFYDPLLSVYVPVVKETNDDADQLKEIREAIKEEVKAYSPSDRIIELIIGGFEPYTIDRGEPKEGLVYDGRSLPIDRDIRFRDSETSPGNEEFYAKVLPPTLSDQSYYVQHPEALEQLRRQEAEAERLRQRGGG